MNLSNRQVIKFIKQILLFIQILSSKILITGWIELCCECGKGTVVVAVEPGIEVGTDGVTGVTAVELFTGFILLLT